MRIFRITVMILGVLILLVVGSPSFAYSLGQSNSNLCTEVKEKYVSTEQEWSKLNANVSLMRDEMERLRDLRWDTKITLSVLDDARSIIDNSGRLSPAQRITLNSRIPESLGRMNPDGTFTMTILEASPLEISEAKGRLNRLLTWTEEDIRKTESGLKDTELESHRLSQNLEELERSVEQECKAAERPTPWEQGVPRITSDEIYDRYVEKELLRNEEVAGRRQADIERLLIDRYYSRRHRPLHRSRALFIELRGLNKKHHVRRCYPFKSPWEKRWILEELEKASHHHEFMPRLGKLGSFEVLDVLENSERCYRRLY
jgi:hypothetical protein